MIFRSTPASASTAQAIARRRRSILITMCLGVLMAQIDTSVVNLAARQIGQDLHASLSQLQWVIDAYNLAYATLLLSGGALGDLFGRRRLFLAGVALFALGSAMCSLAPAIGWLLAGRAVAGVGAAVMLPNSLAILADTYPEAKARSQAIGVWAGCNGLAFALGPTIGGMLVDSAGWRSIFALILPLAGLAGWMARQHVPATRGAPQRKLDLPGQILAAAALAALAFAVIQWPVTGPHALIMRAAIAVAMLATPAFIGWQIRCGDGLMPLALFRNASFSAAMIIAAAMTFGMYGLIFLLPLLLQSSYGLSALEAGLAMLPMSLSFLIVSRYVGSLAHALGPRAAMSAGMSLMGAGLLALSWAGGETGGALPLAGLMALLLLPGVGLGLNTGPVMSVAVSSVPAERTGTAAGLINTARMVGATLGVAVLGAVAAAHMMPAAGAHGWPAGYALAFRGGGCVELAGALVASWKIKRDALVRQPC